MSGPPRAGAARGPAGGEGRPGRPITDLPGVGSGLAARLARLRIHTAEQLLLHLPLRYEDRTRITPLPALRPGDRALICAEIRRVELRPGRRRSLLVELEEGGTTLLLRFFHFSSPQQRSLGPGVRLSCFGEVRGGPHGPEMVHPDYRVLDPGEPAVGEATLSPVYPTTEGLGQGVLRRLTGRALLLLDTPRFMPELLPAALLRRLRLPALAETLRAVHQPPAGSTALLRGDHPHRDVRRLAFEELLAHHLSLRLVRQRGARADAPRLTPRTKLAERFIRALPFELTTAQRRVQADIAADMERAHPMHRLVQGDVGSGKTVVAALAALQAIAAGWQVALMAPTELLAEQHLQTFTRWFTPLGAAPVWLAGGMAQAARARSLEAAASGAADIVIGTHALFQDQVRFARLGLVIVDEQHRFGVHQRLALRAKGAPAGALRPHMLIMTATPIPRTLAMAAYADLDTSAIDALPPGRSPVETVVIPEARRAEVLERVSHECLAGRQAYWVCTLVEESEQIQARAAADVAASLAGALPALRIGLVHGRMRGTEKERAMAAFLARETDLLVATTVIEVGVDVPNATLMVIENAERLGLAQLHQLRGRVGRGPGRSHCVLLYQRPLAAPARARLGVLRESGDGFEIARRDLELRGPGEVLGTRQTGLLQFRVADLGRDGDLVDAIEAAAEELLREHPERVPDLIDRWLGPALAYAEA